MFSLRLEDGSTITGAYSCDEWQTLEECRDRVRQMAIDLWLRGNRQVAIVAPDGVTYWQDLMADAMESPYWGDRR